MTHFSRKRATKVLVARVSRALSNAATTEMASVRMTPSRAANPRTVLEEYARNAPELTTEYEGAYEGQLCPLLADLADDMTAVQEERLRRVATLDEEVSAWTAAVEDARLAAVPAEALEVRMERIGALEREKNAVVKVILDGKRETEDLRAERVRLDRELAETTELLADHQRYSESNMPILKYLFSIHRRVSCTKITSSPDDDEFKAIVAQPKKHQVTTYQYSKSQKSTFDSVNELWDLIEVDDEQ